MQGTKDDDKNNNMGEFFASFCFLFCMSVVDLRTERLYKLNCPPLFCSAVSLVNSRPTSYQIFIGEFLPDETRGNCDD